MAEILAIVSKNVFETTAYVGGRLAAIGDVWPTDRYVSAQRVFESLAIEGGRILLVTVRPPDDTLWFVGSLEAPAFEDGAWIARPNNRRVTDITALRQTILFTSGKGISQTEGMLGMSLQTPRALMRASAAAILGLAGGDVAPPPPGAPRTKAPVVEAAETAAERTIREGRAAPLDAARERYVVLADRMEETFGLRLPEQLALAFGFHAALLPEERALFEEKFGRWVGVARWFEGPDLPPPPDGDERLRDRLLDDPPEFVPILARADGTRWGLWYDEPSDLPTGFARRSLRASAGVYVASGPASIVRLHPPDLLTIVKEHLFGRPFGQVPAFDEMDAPQPEQNRPLARWLDEVLALARELPQTSVPMPAQGWLVGELFNPYVPDGRVPVDLVGYATQTARFDTYVAASNAGAGAEAGDRREDARATIEGWIDRARDELRDGSPMRALFLGRELHTMQIPALRLACTELLVRAYGALDRGALSGVVRAAYRAADPSAPIFEPPPAHEAVVASTRDDVDELNVALARGALSADDLNEALATTSSEAILDRLLDHAESADLLASTSRAVWRRLLAYLRDPAPIARGATKPARAESLARHTEAKARERVLLGRLFARGAVDDRTFTRALRSGDAPLIADVARRVALVPTVAPIEASDDGSPPTKETPLHRAAAASSVEAVRILLDRGADPGATNGEGRRPYDVALATQGETPSDPRPTEIMTLLQSAGGGIQKPPPPVSDEIEYAEGDPVHHRKLGDGEVVSVTGEGEEAKVLIRFASETRVFLAKFITPR